ncbi:hypothetical protein [Streptomyces sp. NPDC093260]|uniref:hypothetical protein n=1 Tax=Streptomyces sp. NPDC093260 TaxID=3155073 RepID=UPI003433C260
MDGRRHGGWSATVAAPASAVTVVCGRLGAAVVGIPAGVVIGTPLRPASLS